MGLSIARRLRSTKVVPINNEIDVEQKFPRATLGQLYDLIESDLKEAEKYLKVTQWQEPQYKYRGTIEQDFTLSPPESISTRATKTLTRGEPKGIGH